MSPTEFASYATLHSYTELALFSKEHVIRLHRMAGIKLNESLLNEFEPMHWPIVEPLVDAWVAQGRKEIL